VGKKFESQTIKNSSIDTLTTSLHTESNDNLLIRFLGILDCIHTDGQTYI